jgi:enamine deaminase RidA (YjgF/YER057c/UK114 family)
VSREHISSASPFEDRVGFSRAVRIGSRVIVSGTAPIGDDGQTVGIGNAYAQAKRCLQIIETALQQAGAGLTEVVRTRIFLVNPDDWEEVARAHRESFGEVEPASTFVAGLQFVNPDWLVEMEAEAVVGESQES